jgi:hypothetical protein
MAKCLNPPCPHSAIAGSDFCETHQPDGRPVVYVRKESTTDILEDLIDAWEPGPSKPREKDDDDKDSGWG